MDLPHLEQVLRGIRSGEIQVTVVESLTPSPVAQSLLWDFISTYMYEWDAPKAERQLQTLGVSRDLLQDLLKDVNLADLLRPEAVDEVRGRLRHTAPMAQARSAQELAVLFQTLGRPHGRGSRGAVYGGAVVAGSPSWRGPSGSCCCPIPTAQGNEQRWVAAEHLPEYVAAFDLEKPTGRREGTKVGDLTGEALGAQASRLQAEAMRSILTRYLAQVGPVTQDAILARYAFPCEWLQAELAALVAQREVAQGSFTPGEPVTADEFVDRRTLEQMHRRTLSILRHEVRPAPFAGLCRLPGPLAASCTLRRGSAGAGALRQVLQQLRAAPIVGPVWERDVLPLRLAAYDPTELAALCQSGELVWVGSGGVDARRGRIRFLFRGEGSSYLEPPPAEMTALSCRTRSTSMSAEERRRALSHRVGGGEWVGQRRRWTPRCWSWSWRAW